MLEDKQRILIIGNSGSGKSTFGKFLSEKLNLPLIHLDKYFWKPGWKLPEQNEWTESVRELISDDRWIIEGNYYRTFMIRALRTDLIYFFDYSTVLCLYRIHKRVIKSKLKLEIREDMAEGCEEKWADSEFVNFVRRYKKVTRPKMFAVLDEINFNKNNLVVFKNRKEFKAYIKYLKKL